MVMIGRNEIAEEFRSIQDYICSALEAIDGKSVFTEDLWKRDEGGGGRTRILSQGEIIEKGGVAFSEVYGPVTEVMKGQLGLNGTEFYATGVSVVLHAHHPRIPIIHMNIRYFELDSGEYWFGGGIDLTPHYVDEKLAISFHEKLKEVCDRFEESSYERYTEWAHQYFFNVHRKESRGVGGIFFDHLSENKSISKSDIFLFCLELGKLFPIAYQEQVEAGRTFPSSDKEMLWRNIRRGRYVEFNLVYDRGTKFGLLSEGRVESILMSLPNSAGWEYNFHPSPGSEEEKTLNLLREKKFWID
jgi:coproporphyrinogen III oxidase